MTSVNSTSSASLQKILTSTEGGYVGAFNHHDVKLSTTIPEIKQIKSAFSQKSITESKLNFSMELKGQFGLNEKVIGYIEEKIGLHDNKALDLKTAKEIVSELDKLQKVKSGELGRDALEDMQHFTLAKSSKVVEEATTETSKHFEQFGMSKYFPNTTGTRGDGKHPRTDERGSPPPPLQFGRSRSETVTEEIISLKPGTTTPQNTNTITQGGIPISDVDESEIVLLETRPDVTTGGTSESNGETSQVRSDDDRGETSVSSSDHSIVSTNNPLGVVGDETDVSGLNQSVLLTDLEERVPKVRSDRTGIEEVVTGTTDDKLPTSYQTDPLPTDLGTETTSGRISPLVTDLLKGIDATDEEDDAIGEVGKNNHDVPSSESDRVSSDPLPKNLGIETTSGQISPLVTDLLKGIDATDEEDTVIGEVGENNHDAPSDGEHLEDAQTFVTQTGYTKFSKKFNESGDEIGKSGGFNVLADLGKFVNQSLKDKVDPPGRKPLFVGLKKYNENLERYNTAQSNLTLDTKYNENTKLSFQSFKQSLAVATEIAKPRAPVSPKRPALATVMEKNLEKLAVSDTNKYDLFVGTRRNEGLRGALFADDFQFFTRLNLFNVELADALNKSNPNVGDLVREIEGFFLTNTGRFDANIAMLSEPLIRDGVSEQDLKLVDDRISGYRALANSVKDPDGPIQGFLNFALLVRHDPAKAKQLLGL